MCSNSCDNDLEDLRNALDTDTFKLTGDNTLCRKCPESACVVLRKKDPLCRTCFLSYCTHKFRATIGKSHKVKPKQKVLLAFSGGAASTALLHMINEGLAEEAHKKFLFKPFILYVDESPFSGWNESDTSSFHQNVLRKMLSFGHPCFISSIGSVFRDPSCIPSYLQVNSEDEAKAFIGGDLHKTEAALCLEHIKSVSSKEDFLKHIKWTLIRDVAAAENMDFIFSGECCTFLATQVLTSMALGRGSQVAQDTAFSDPLKGVAVLRPLREFQSKEIAMYNQLHHIQFFVHPTLTTKKAPCTSLHQVTEAFVVELQRDFPATVSTIFRTGDKLSYNPNTSKKLCLLCQSAVDTDLPDSSAVGALKLSEQISKMHVDSESSTEASCCGSCNESCTNKKEPKVADLVSKLCFGCQKIVQNMNSISTLPPEVLHKAHSIDNRKKMLNTIRDYLLEDDCS